jgi:ABC-type Zn uptake system ZnuABC Zn-binding protein ZnuA
MKTLYLLAVCICISCTVFCANTDTGNENNLIGVVKDAITKKPLQDVTIFAKSNAFSAEQKIITDENGQFTIALITAGVYTLRFEKDKYIGLEKKNIVFKKNAGKLIIELTEEEETNEDHHTWLFKFDFI